jgi:hypothetical protein
LSEEENMMSYEEIKRMNRSTAQKLTGLVGKFEELVGEINVVALNGINEDWNDIDFSSLIHFSEEMKNKSDEFKELVSPVVSNIQKNDFELLKE